MALIVKGFLKFAFVNFFNAITQLDKDLVFVHGLGSVLLLAISES